MTQDRQRTGEEWRQNIVGYARLKTYMNAVCVDAGQDEALEAIWLGDVALGGMAGCMNV